MQTIETKVLIIGSGPAGYTAAIYAARANLKPVLVQGHEPGGQLTITTDVENYPGFKDPIQGPWLMEQMKAQAEHVGAQMIWDTITDVDFSKRPFVCKGEGGDTYVAQTVIIATGAQARWLGIEGEKKFNGLGVSACATCDGFFFKGQDVAVIGGGNSAVEEALYLSGIAKTVTVIHRRDSFRSERILQDRLFAKDNVKVVWDHTVEDVLGVERGGEGTPGMTGILIKNVKTGATQTLPVTGMFVAIGHAPATALFKGKLKMDAAGYLVTAPDSTATEIPGVFAAGDVKDHVYRQAVTAAGMGCMAALEADRFLAAQDGATDKKATQAA
ncbi:MAG: thioredoxin-disulfide reductase [Rhodospirillales bacterium]|nr:thioredoxin-disulfide reductase [Rhodospirillales bacterium]USO07707.1 MAG: thioredoxin-disulfide reductase [Rhodospirillales bacterium]